MFCFALSYVIVRSVENRRGGGGGYKSLVKKCVSRKRLNELKTFLLKKKSGKINSFVMPYYIFVQSYLHIYQSIHELHRQDMHSYIVL